MNRELAAIYLFLRVAVTGTLLSLGTARLGAADAPEEFREGDRWCALGDGATQFGAYQQWIELFYLTRFPGREISTFNCGVAGDTPAGALHRLDWDVLVHRPTVVSVMFGMDAIGGELYRADQGGDELMEERRERMVNYRTGMRSLVEAIQAAGARVILLTPSIYDRSADRSAAPLVGIEDALAECSAYLHELAAETGAALVDFHGPMARIAAARQGGHPPTTEVGAERMNSGAVEHLLMAYHFLKAQAVSGPVSRLAIDLDANLVAAADNGVATQIVRDRDTLTFEWAEDALPFPVDPSVASALAWVPFVEDFNQELLQVVGLRPGVYELDIDGEAVGTFDSRALAAGVNLAAETKTPQYQQAVDLLRLMEARSELERDNIRGVAQLEHQWAPQIQHPVTVEKMRDHLQEEGTWARNPSAESTAPNMELYSRRKENLALTTASMNRLERLIRLAAVPRSHLYRLRRVR